MAEVELTLIDRDVLFLKLKIIQDKYYGPDRSQVDKALRDVKRMLYITPVYKMTYDTDHEQETQSEPK